MIELALRLRGDKPRGALLEDRRLTEYWDLETPPAVSPEAVLLGRAGRVMKSLGAMFVTLPEGKEGFLPFDEMTGDAPPKPGDSLIVQVKRPSVGNKAAYVSMDVSLAGRLSILLPLGGAAHASRRAGDSPALAALAAAMKPEGMGLVLRASAQGAVREEILAEIGRHVSQWQGLLMRSKSLSAPAVLQCAPDTLSRRLRDLRRPPDSVLTDDGKAAEVLGLPCTLSEDPFALLGVEQQLVSALRRRVYLRSGGTLVLDPCEAALLIDVNTAGDTRRGGDLILRTNLEAAGEIARLLRLRRAGGVILIDFIDMKSKEQQEAVLARLKEALREDPVQTEVLGFTRLGLVEMTRRKADVPLPAQRLDAGAKHPDDEFLIPEENDA